jgi:hypothetical protein
MGRSFTAITRVRIPSGTPNTLANVYAGTALVCGGDESAEKSAYSSFYSSDWKAGFPSKRRKGHKSGQSMFRAKHVHTARGTLSGRRDGEKFSIRASFRSPDRAGAAKSVGWRRRSRGGTPPRRCSQSSGRARKLAGRYAPRQHGGARQNAPARSESSPHRRGHSHERQLVTDASTCLAPAFP